MNFQIAILPNAEADIFRNSLWWAEHYSQEQAEKWINAVQRQIHELDQFPESNPISSEAVGFPYEIRDKLVGLGSRRSYRAIFAIHGDTVYVVAVRRATQDVLRVTDIDPFPSR